MSNTLPDNRPRIFKKISGGVIIRTKERLDIDNQVSFENPVLRHFGHVDQWFIPCKKGTETFYILKCEFDFVNNHTFTTSVGINIG